MKKRSTLKLLIELYFVGIVEDASIFVHVIKDITSAEHLKDREATQTNLSLLSTFARQARFFVGLQSRGQEAYDEVRMQDKFKCQHYLFNLYKALEKKFWSHNSTAIVDLGAFCLLCRPSFEVTMPPPSHMNMQAYFFCRLWMWLYNSKPYSSTECQS